MENKILKRFNLNSAKILTRKELKSINGKGSCGETGKIAISCINVYSGELIIGCATNTLQWRHENCF
ncbi:hypothetical protein [Leptobacterium sp. I13]|uniref:hypothetical protein n=1 Tax=Leptobacterium meishanense TaxID=3128904 RepID=UPI0030EE069D